MAADTSAADLIAQARAANSMGRPATAEQLLRRAIRVLSRPGATLEERQLRGAAVVALSSPVFERHGLGPALEVLGEADALLDGPEGEGVRTLSAVQRAGFLARGGEWRVAVELLATIGRHNPWLTRPQLVSGHLNRAPARQYLGDPRASIAGLRTPIEPAVAADRPDPGFNARPHLRAPPLPTGDAPP